MEEVHLREDKLVEVGELTEVLVEAGEVEVLVAAGEVREAGELVEAPCVQVIQKFDLYGKTTILHAVRLIQIALSPF